MQLDALPLPASVVPIEQAIAACLHLGCGVLGLVSKMGVLVQTNTLEVHRSR